MEEQLRELIKEAQGINNGILEQQLTQALNTVLAGKNKENEVNTTGTLPREPAIESVWGAGNNREWYLREQQQEKPTTPVHTEEEIKEIRRQSEEAKNIIAQALENAELERAKAYTNNDNITSIEKGEVTTIYNYTNGNYSIESAYTSYKSNATDSSLKNELDSLLIDMALDDAKNTKESIKGIHEIAKKYNNNYQDIVDIQGFLSKVSEIGTIGKNIKNEYFAILKGETTENSNNITNYYNDTSEKLYKGIDMLDMQFDEIKNKNNVDSNTYKEIIAAYRKKLREAEDLYDETANVIDPANLELLSDAIKALKEQIQACENYIKQIQDISKEASDSFNI